MPYKSSLESKIAKKTTKAIIYFNLIEDGDRVMVGLSGGKDSWALMQTLDQLRRRAPIKFSLMAVSEKTSIPDTRTTSTRSSPRRAGTAGESFASSTRRLGT